MSGHKPWSGIEHKGQEPKLDPTLNRTIRFTPRPNREFMAWFIQRYRETLRALAHR